MRALPGRLLGLFVDSAWLAGGALTCVFAAGALLWLATPAGVVGVVLFVALVMVLAVSVTTSVKKKRDG